MRKKLLSLALGLCLMLGMTGCGESDPVPVVRVDSLTTAALAADQFAGVVVSDNSVTVKRESDKTVAELLVTVGEKVTAGQKLFSYDSDELELTLDKQELELDRLEAEIKETKEQIKDVEKELKSAKDSTKTQLNIQLRQLEMELTQSTYDQESAKTEIAYTKKMLQNIDITSTIDGTIRSINDEDPDNYIVIQQAGAYRVKGLMNELSMNAGLMEGSAVEIVSRLDASQVWSGVVSLVDYENAEQNAYDSMYGYGNTSSMTSSSSYPFYVSLDSTDGLLLGQHVYIRMAMAGQDPEGVYIPENYLMDVLYSDETGQTTASVWAVGPKGTLEKRAVVLGDYDMATGCYGVLEGLERTDYVADPANPDCKEGAPISINGQNGFVDDSGLTPAQQESIAASIAYDIEFAED